MKIPISWLSEYVELDDTPEAIADRLTFSGTEVEGIHRIGGGLDDLVVGEILSVDKHPNADRLRLCQVAGAEGPVPVVCGATNFNVGDKAAFAPVGAVLPGGMRIKRTKIRGEESLGMLCAEDELGLSEGHEGILLLDKALETGSPLAAALPPPETVLELEITWNRSDCLSVIGMARELAAVMGKPLKLPEVDLGELSGDVARDVTVALDDPKGCPRYTARAIDNVTVGPSPEWMQRRLTLCGIRPINTIVDITNYVLLECGQPLHAFDYDKLKGPAITVRRAREGEVMTTLDEVERKLEPSMLVIDEGGEAVALAGVMGGGGSEIEADSTRVLLESATFDPALIHRCSRAVGLTSESCHRFERGVAPELADWASRRAAGLMASLAGGTVRGGVVDVYPCVREPVVLTCRFDRTRELLGIDLKNADMVVLLQSVGFGVDDIDGNAATIRVPSHRLDIEIEADLIEEIARLNGIDAVPAAAPRAIADTQVDDSRFRAEAICREALIDLGLAETMNYSFMAETDVATFNCGPAGDRLPLENPVSADHGTLRDSLIPQMVQSLGRNRSRQIVKASFFEIGTTFRKMVGGPISESRRLCVGLLGEDGGGDDAAGHAFLAAKGLLTAICERLHAGDVTVAPVEHGALASGWSVAVSVGGEGRGVLGQIKPELLTPWRIQSPLVVFEVDLDPLLANVFRVPSYTDVPVYPSILRDVAVIVPDDVRHEQIVATIEAAAPDELTAVNLFDIFRGEGVGDGRKSMAYSLVYRSHERTLTDDDANRFDVVIRDALKRDLNVEIREG